MATRDAETERLSRAVKGSGIVAGLLILVVACVHSVLFSASVRK